MSPGTGEQKMEERTDQPALMVLMGVFTVGVVNASPNGSGVCYTQDGLCVAGTCQEVFEGTSLALVLEGYNGQDGTYKIKPTCEGGKDLSNVIVLDVDGNCSVKAENEPGAPFPDILIEIVGGEPVQSFSMKCGSQCWHYGDDSLTCN